MPQGGKGWDEDKVFRKMLQLREPKEDVEASDSQEAGPEQQPTAQVWASPPSPQPAPPLLSLQSPHHLLTTAVAVIPQRQHKVINNKNNFKNCITMKVSTYLDLPIWPWVLGFFWGTSESLYICSNQPVQLSTTWEIIFKVFFVLFCFLFTSGDYENYKGFA